MWKFWQHRQQPSDRARTLYDRVVMQARQPAFYSEIGVPDSPEGRYEMIVLHLCLAVERLQALGEEGTALARALNEQFIVDLDDNMREMGVGDLTVPKKVKRAAAGLLERATDYRAAVRAGGDRALSEALRQHFPPGLSTTLQFQNQRLATYYLAAREILQRQPDESIRIGKLDFSAPI